MGRVGRPRSAQSPPCPDCETEDDVVRHDIVDADGGLKRRYRCTGCAKVFVPGLESKRPSDDLKVAVRRIREETQAPYRLIASAITHHLGMEVSHTTVSTWCREPTAVPDGERDQMPCEYLSVLWALRHEIEQEKETATGFAHSDT